MNWRSSQRWLAAFASSSKPIFENVALHLLCLNLFQVVLEINNGEIIFFRVLVSVLASFLKQSGIIPSQIYAQKRSLFRVTFPLSTARERKHFEEEMHQIPFVQAVHSSLLCKQQDFSASLISISFLCVCWEKFREEAHDKFTASYNSHITSKASRRMLDFNDREIFVELQSFPRAQENKNIGGTFLNIKRNNKSLLKYFLQIFIHRAMPDKMQKACWN